MDIRSTADGSGTLDEALERVHRSGPEREGWLSNHAPMAVEALVLHGHAPSVHRWLDGYRDKLEEMPAPSARVTDDGWQEALGDPRRLADWIAYFQRALEDRPWREVLAEWWPRLLPGISAAATHGVIRVGHAVRTLLGEEAAAGARDRAGAGSIARDDAGATARQETFRPSPVSPRVTELAHALGYWAARHSALPRIRSLPAERSYAAGLAAVPRVDDQSGGIRERLARITALPARTGATGREPDPAQARRALEELVRAATHRYATHAHGSPVMLVHAATAPNAVLRTLPALPGRLWLPSLDAAWSAATAVTASYTPAAAAPPPATAAGLTAGEVFERAAAHGDEHAIKLTDTALDVAAMDADADHGTVETAPAFAAALRALELIDPAL
ncbi:questin oxidase family protein [Streptomyces sp. HNM0575]|uniref:questin oxidase family protein n=1 Tax=Streptomyces sp. HNM0575 TaxID=2716338 RepID=UPI00145F425E|nr:questin oxidase family protein [Streptomyces sp. HNM0575]NLU73651.1 questin oxidase family protein [Streptomyces sp. HNM0575]